MNKTLKTTYTACILLILLTLILVLAALPFLPDRIPAHYDAAGVVNRWGSKYEMLIFPGFLLPYGALWLGTCRICREFPSGEIGERIIVIGGVAQFAVFDLMTAYFLYASFRQVENLAFMPLDLNQLLCGLSGLGFIALGNWMPKLKEPGPVGLRTPWSVKSTAVWRKCQRFGGWVMAAMGAVCVLAALLAEGAWCWLWMAAAAAAALAASVVYSRHAAKPTPDE